MITKPKNRYLLIESTAPLPTRDISVASAITDAIIAEIGNEGYLRAGPKIMDQFNDNVFIMRVNRGCENSVTLATSFVKEIRGTRLGLYTVKTSGTMRKLIDFCKETYN